MKILALLFTFVSLAAGNKPNIIDILRDDLSYAGSGSPASWLGQKN
tara:strand:+ start:74 stop:211 length:138 start_codon:yes stop_codon:yes gene_type:complete